MPKTKAPVTKVKKAAPKKTAKAAVEKTHKVEAGMSVSAFKLDGTKTADIAVDTKVIKSVSPQLLAQTIRVYQVNKRQGTVSTKTRGEVTGSTRKIYRQKGTGRARHGAITAPVFVGGGITFGPKPREFALSIPQKMKQGAFSSILKDRITHNALSVVTGLKGSSGKTKEVAALLTKMGINGKKLLLILDGSMKKAHAGSRNIANVTIKSATSVSIYDVLEHDHMVVASEVLDTLMKRGRREKIV